MNPPSSPAFALSRRDALRFLGLAGATAFMPGLVARAADMPAADSAKPSAPSAAAGAPPSLAGPQAGFYRLRIGDFEALALNDGGFGGPIGGAPWVGGSPDKMEADLAQAFMDPDTFDLPFNVLLVHMGSELVLIDSGAGTVFGPSGGRLPACLAAAGVRPEQITMVILTHGHGDHFGGLLDVKTMKPVFSQAKHFIHRREFEFWTSSSPDLSALPFSADAKQQAVKSAQSYLTALKNRWQFIVPGDKLLPGLEILDAPGHTPGHIALEFSSGNQQLLHFVDTVHHHAISFANPDWHFSFDVQPEVAVATRRKLLDRAAASRTRLFGAHVPFNGLGHVRKVGDHYEHVIEPWAMG